MTLHITLTYNCDFQRIEKSNKDLHDRGSFIKTAMGGGGGFFWGGFGNYWNRWFFNFDFFEEPKLAIL